MKIIQTILLIEDNEAFIESCKLILRSTIATIERILVARTLNEGIEIIKDNGIDLVILDPGLPDSKGLSSMRAIKEQYPRVNLIILTATDDPRLAISAERYGVRYITKTALAEGYTAVLTTEIRLAMLGSHEEPRDVSPNHLEASFDLEDMTDLWRWRGQVEEQLKGLTFALQDTVRNLVISTKEMKDCFTQVNTKIDKVNDITFDKINKINLRLAYWTGGGFVIGIVLTIIAKALKIL